MKYGNRTLGEFEALLNIIGEENALAILRGEKTMVIEDCPIKLFDKHGRRIPPRGSKKHICDPDNSYHFIQPEINYGNRLAYFGMHFQPFMSATEFETQGRKLLTQLSKDTHLCNLLKGVHLPICLPRLDTVNFDYGQVLESLFLPAVRLVYLKQFSNRNFFNRREGALEGKVDVIKYSRHDRLITRMRDKDLVVGIYFPGSLHGFSGWAAREQMDSLPEGLLLAGGFDTAIALVMYPDVMAPDCYTPGLELSALSYNSDFSLFFGCNSGELVFDRHHPPYASPLRSSGLLFLG